MTAKLSICTSVFHFLVCSVSALRCLVSPARVVGPVLPRLLACLSANFLCSRPSDWFGLLRVQLCIGSFVHVICAFAPMVPACGVLSLWWVWCLAVMRVTPRSPSMVRFGLGLGANPSLYKPLPLRVFCFDQVQCNTLHAPFRRQALCRLQSPPARPGLRARGDDGAGWRLLT